MHERVGKQGGKHAGDDHAEHEACCVEHADFGHMELHLCEEIRHRHAERMAQPFSEKKLTEQKCRRGDGVADPASREREGDIGTEAHRQQRRGKCLKRHEHQRKKHADGESGGNGVAAWDPQASVGDWP